MLNELKWMDTKTNYENAMQKCIYKIINNKENHQFKYYFTINRNVRMHAQNKLGPHDQIMGQSPHTHKSFLFRAIDIYNKLPKELTLIKTFPIFKKWIKIYNLDNKIKLPR